MPNLRVLHLFLVGETSTIATVLQRLALFSDPIELHLYWYDKYPFLMSPKVIDRLNIKSMAVLQHGSREVKNVKLTRSFILDTETDSPTPGEETWVIKLNLAGSGPM